MSTVESREKYSTPGFQAELNSRITNVRERVDQGFGEQLLAMSRGMELEVAEGDDDLRYHTIIVGALLLRIGARISPDDCDHLRKIANEVPCHIDNSHENHHIGFRGAGKAQFLAALDAYSHGTPRDFFEPSCFHCGKITSEIEGNILRCARCSKRNQSTWYCDSVCLSYVLNSMCSC
ncbi:hypothetical protein B0T21DRAFT_298718 [Apiosordaria backusii]|uniref:Suppressor of anucleate metulae protein B n=1 Tax=Apiosordaria backusii TaxID=314023 RepID=A0AA40A0U3_9PEZI|nr:hypothetical protein B0T21DRAFT_298718 [Apiosordaria backusii]